MNLKNRIKKSYEFKEIINKRRFIKFVTFNVYYKKSELSYSRFGLSVSKRLGNAVTRNKIKRRLRAQLLQIEFYDLCVDFIIIARPSILCSKNEDIYKDLQEFAFHLKEKVNEQKN